MRYSIAIMGLAFALFSFNNALALNAKMPNPGPPPVAITAAKDSGGDVDDVHSKNPIKKIRGKWSWLNHEKSGCTETVYVLGTKKEDIYTRPVQDDNTDSSGEKPKHKPAKATHKSIGLEYHQKDGIVFLISTAGGKHWLSAYRFADDDTLMQQTIYLDDGHQYTPFAGDLPKWNEVSVQDGEDQLARCGQESESVMNGTENADDDSGSQAKSVSADESDSSDDAMPATPASPGGTSGSAGNAPSAPGPNDSSNYTVPANPDTTGGLGGTSPPAR